MRVLLVQSDSQSSQMLTRFFKERGDDLFSSTDLAQAFNLLKEEHPEVLLLDLHFPGSGWLTFMRQARQHSPDLKIILTNKYPDLQREILAAENGVNVFLRQPFTKTWIDHALTRAFEKYDVRGPERSRAPLPRVRIPVRFKITLPYLVLSLLFALGAAFIVSQVVLVSVQDRYLTQVMDTGRQTSDWMVREENRLLGTLRLASNVQGPEAVRANNAETIRSLIAPLVMSAAEEDVQVLGLDAVAIFSMRQNTSAGPGQYDFARGELFFQKQSFVSQTLVSGPDQTGDKYAGLVVAPWGSMFYVCGPIYAPDNSVVGAILIGKSLLTLVRQSGQETMAEVSFYDLGGLPLASTLFTAAEAYPVEESLARSILTKQDQASFTRSLTFPGIDYTEVIGPLEARNGMDLGLVGTALSKTYLTNTTNVTQGQVFVMMVAAVLLVVGVGLFLANRITGPLVRLANASSEVAQGNLEIKVNSNGDDEVAVLAQSFNYMVAGLQEGSIYRDLLGRTVSPEVREELRQTFTSGNIRLEGQQAVATILMTDIRSFTTLSEKADPAAVLLWLNEYFGRLVPIVTAHGGVVNKFDGDAMLAFFGILPSRLSPKLGASSACQAALEINKVVNELNARRMERGEPQLVTGIGLNTGVVIAGGLGSSDRMHYTIIGDTVNTAQRLESLTRQIYSGSGILIGHSTYQALADGVTQFHLESAGTYAVKGKSEQIQVYRLLTEETYVPEMML
jgi:class 3 adenylate cyclase/CheY-like chemotaxis protein